MLEIYEGNTSKQVQVTAFEGFVDGKYGVSTPLCLLGFLSIH